jgi:cell wall integrity and stress response component
MKSVSTLPTYAAASKLTVLDNWPFQSNGNCTNHCINEGTYAFAVIQYTDCYCSNYIPANQEDISDCQKDCPGYPDEKCGNRDEGLFMYIKMDGKPSGTLGGSSSSAPATSAPAATSQASSSQAPTVSKTSLFLSLTPLFCILLGIFIF